MGVIMALNSNETGFDAGNETLLRSVALQVAGRLMPELIQDMIEATVNDHGMGQEDVEKFKALLTAENAPSKAVQRMADQVVSGDMVNELISSPLAKSSGRLSPIQTRVPEEMNRVATPRRKWSVHSRCPAHTIAGRDAGLVARPQFCDTVPTTSGSVVG